MSQLLIQQYLNQLQILKRVSGTTRESVVREAFKDLLKNWARSLDLIFIPEYEFETKTKERRYIDGALLHTLRVPFGYWEAKDEKDDIDAEIEAKFRRGYPKTNIVFEDSREAVLIQHGEEVMRCGVEEVDKLEKLLTRFFSYERPEVEAFRKAVEQFKTDLPAVLEALRSLIDRAYREVPVFRKAAGEFLKHAQEVINPSLTEADVREMLIQHILTGEVFAAVFPGTTYHEDNSVARELHKLEETFFTGNTRHQSLKGLEPYYAAIRKAAADIVTHHQKQTFLKSIYENFYKVYNPKAADRLGVVYTPNEIVRFMIDSADWLCEQHFGRNLIDKDVDILDPATGTGTFICELIEHFAGQREKLAKKYRHELHANEVAILPYYVANLNIEATYAAATGRYEEFPGLCFVDTLDNTYALRKHRGHMDDMFGSVSDDNVKRIRQQNSRRISVIIGNPPYNANQLNENENNKNREYPEIDKRIKETYIAASTAQKTKLYDMYARFFRWATDRLDENGVLAFVTNSSFIEKKTFDGFRRFLSTEFDSVYIVDLGGEMRDNDALGNVFGITVGVAISFWVRKAAKNARQRKANLRYHQVSRSLNSSERLGWLQTPFSDIGFTQIEQPELGEWLKIGDNDFAALVPIASKRAKAGAKGRGSQTIFQTFSLGLSTNRDEWVYAESADSVRRKATFLHGVFETEKRKPAGFAPEIKWSRNLKRRLSQGRSESIESIQVSTAVYRPFTRKWFFDSSLFIDERGRLDIFFPRTAKDTPCIVVSDPTSQKKTIVLAVDGCFDLHLVGAASGAVGFPLWRGHSTQGAESNVTDWALEQFRKQYRPGRGKKDRPVTKEAIFHYVYGVLHDPTYREKYALNLKREFPRIPVYADFWQWADWGGTLMDLHIGYEAVEPWKLKRRDVTDEKARKASLAPKATLKADKEGGRIVLDSETVLEGIPPEAWEYKLGNRSALEWILDQYKEKKSKDPTIREKFNTYRFADYKEKVIDLLARTTRVSVETRKIVEAMRRARQ